MPVMNYTLPLSLVPLTLFIAFRIFTIDTSHFADRKIGDPLEGHWYYPELGAGCFQNAGLIKFTVDQMQVIMGGNKKRIYSESKIVDIKIKDGVVEEHLTNYRGTKGREVILHEFATYEDSGNLLTVITSHGMVEGKRIKLKGPVYIRRCSSPTFWGKFKLALGWEKSFKPNTFKNERMQ